MRVAVIGGGVFGCTAAIELARGGAQVDLFEARPHLLDGATGRCQGRLHRGYHYPRSDATAAAARDASVEFAARFPTAVKAAPGGHFYAIAPGSKTTPEQYEAFCDRLGLGYTRAMPAQLHTADACYRVTESLIDVPVLARLLRAELAGAGVKVNLDRRADVADLAGRFDAVVVATYGQPWPRPLRYEVCEVALLELGRYDGASFVVQDGEFVSLDPYGNRLYALYDVAHSVHHASVGCAPEVPSGYVPLLNRPRAVTRMSNVDKMIESAGRFLRFLDPAGLGVSIYHGSMFSVRAVLPDADATDERPTLVEVDANVVWMLAGKIDTSVVAARQVTSAVLGERVPA